MDGNLMERYRKQFETELFVHTLPFWLNHARDQQHGGIFSCLDRTGAMYSTDKSVWMQGRCAWTFARMCGVYGKNDEWLALASDCIRFLNEHCIDPADRRMYFTVTREGKPLRKRRYFFSEAFYIIANAENGAVTGDCEALERARFYYDFVCGIYDDPGADPYRITPKTIPETRKCRSLADTMILLDVTCVMHRCDSVRRAVYDERLRFFTDDLVRYHYKAELQAVLETVGERGEFLADISAGRVVNPGHDLEASWFLLEAAKILADDSLACKARNIYDWALRRGRDAQYGGILYFTDVLGLPPEQYEHDMKLWWPHNEAIIAALNFYCTTREQRFLDDFIRLTDYAFSVFPDHEYGEWYGYLRRDGKPTEPPCKGSTYKGPFHLPRMLITVERMLEELCETALGRPR